LPNKNETPANHPNPTTMKTRLIDGFIVYGHLVLTLCNIVLLE